MSEAMPFLGGESQEAFMTRIRQRLRPDPDDRGYPGSRLTDDDPEVRYSQEEKMDMFLQSWTEVGGEAYRVASEEALVEQLLHLCRQQSMGKLLLSSAAQTTCGHALAAEGIIGECWDDVSLAPGGIHRDLAHVDTWDAGVAWVDFAVAETGSVVIVSRPEQGRSVSLLPPVFIALIKRDALIYARRTVFERMSKQGRKEGVPSSFTFITGLSRSADIEMDLSIGVHGPGRVFALLLDG